MALFLLPHSKEQSNMDLVRENLFDVWNQNSFPQLNPIREALIRHFKIPTYPLAPLFRRLKGRFWEELSFWALPKKVQDTLQERSLVLSPLFGIMRLRDLIPKYKVTWKDLYQEERLKSFWKRHLAELFRELLDGETLYDFSSSEDREAIALPESTRLVRFTYYRKGRRVINTLPHRAYTLRYIVEMGVGESTLEKINFLDYRVREVKEEGNLIEVVFESEGKYI